MGYEGFHSSGELGYNPFMQDLVVGIVTCLTGLWFLAGAAMNNQFLLDLHKTRWFVSLWGRGGARFVLAVLGAGLVALGVAIIRGWRLPLL